MKRNAKAAALFCRISTSSYYGSISGPKEVTKTSVSMILYEKGVLGYKQVDSATASANSNTCSKSVNYSFKSGKTYKLEITGKAYSNGSWDTLTDSVVKTF